MDKLWPRDTRVDESGELWLGGCAASALAETFGTPLYVFDEKTLRGRARAYQAALKQYYPGSAQTAYASKAYLCLAIAQLFAEEGLDLDVVSGGELYVALRAGFPLARIHFHGNNKSPEELAQALEAGVGRIVVDNFHELDLLADLINASHNIRRPIPNTQYPIWLRLSPGIQAHTHAHIQTGHEDTKFGFAIATGDAERAVALALQTPGLALVGLHAHIGSQIYEPETLAAAATRLVEFAAEMRDRHGFVLAGLSPGGGWGVPMTDADPPAPIETYVAAVAEAVVSACRATGQELPHLVLEPGRSLVAPAAVALYRVGARKEVPGVRTFVSVDGGMADNIRPALYGAKYTALGIRDWGLNNPQSPIPNPQSEVVTIAGKFCESGDVLIRDVELPRLAPGDLLAIPMAGAYTLAMASNYNLAPRPAVVLVKDGQARLIQRRESFEDLVERDLPLNTEYRKPSSRFWKYQALGNDYIVLDPADWPEPPGPDLVRRICDRHRGVGSDGILWGPIGAGEPFALRLFNPDGGEFEKSGNGLRIFARYLWDRGLAPGPDFTINTPGGPVTAHVLDTAGSRIRMEMGCLSFNSQVIPVAGPPREVVEEEVEVAGHQLRITAVTIGNPHCVVFAEDPTPELAHTLGPQLECHPLFPNRSNVQFAHALDQHTLRIEIWERGAGYTLASGTSSCAAAGAAIRTGRCAGPVTVRMPGGEMLVEVAADWSVELTGTVEAVCEGTVSGELGIGY
jgi:diaminopimelate decarboxylase